MITESYKPFQNNSDFLAFKNKRGDIKQLKNIKFGYHILIKPSGYVPKTGILLSKFLEKISFPKKSRVMEVGTGESALLAIHSSFLGGTKIIAIDIDNNAVRWAKKNIKKNKLTKKIKIMKKSVFDFKTNFRSDIIISNPPQMPVVRMKSIHDDGGRDGRHYIIQLIKLANKILKKDGKLIFTAFDFLGVDRNYNKNNPIFEILKHYSFRPKIIKSFRKEIKKTSYTFKNINQIKKVYPSYIFKKNKKGFYEHEVLIVYAKKLN